MESNPIFPSLLALKTAHKQLLSQRREGIDDSFLAEVEAFIQRGCVTGVTLDGDDERWEVQNLLDYWANELLHNKRIAPEATLAEYDPEQAPELPDELCPYRGLDAFDASQKAYFFGRGALVREMMKRLKNGRFLAIVGPSGSGKSSTALAGLLPSLQAGKLANSDSWHIFPAFVPGAAPLDALVRALQPAQQTDSQQNQYLEDPQTLATQLNQHPASLLLIDQFEELYTLCYDPTQRDAFIHNLLGVLQQPENPHTIIITMRSDLEAKLTHIAKFQTLFTDNQVRLSPMNASDLRDTIEKPARLVGLKFEDDVVDALIRDVLGEPAALPLLQFSLLKLWEAREKNRITWAAYRQLGSGRNALANVADTLYNDLPTDEQPSTRHLFLQLVRFGKGLEVSRDRVLRQQLVQSLGNKTAVSHILDQFIQARLIRQAPTATHNNDTIELAHEALLTHWPKFIGWIEEARITQRNRIQFTNMAAQWAELEQDASVLLRGRLLAAAQQFDDCDEIEKAFIAASIQAVDEEAFGKEQARRERLHQAEALAEERQKRLDEKDKLTQRLGRTLVALIALAVFALVAWGVAMRSADAAEQSRATAVASEATALANQTIADTLRETAVANANDLATAEANALRERDQAATNERLAQQAQATVEASFIEVNDARAAAVDSADEAEIQFREATARELAAAAVNQLNSNPQLSLYLALESIYFPLAAGQTPPEESANVLYRALQAAQLQRTFSGHTDWISDIAISPDSLQVATSGYDNSVRIWDRTSGQEQHLIEKHVGAVNTVAFNYSGTQLATGGDDGFVYIWRTSDFELVATLIATLEDEENGRVTAVSFHPDNQRIAVAYDDSSVRVWDIPSLQSQMRLFGHSAPINDVVFNQLGDQFATAGADGLTIVRETDSGTTLYSLKNPDSEPAIGVNGLDFNPTGTQIVTANDDGVARIWQDQQIISTLPGHTSFLFDVAYSDDGTLIATASGDGTARIWQADTGQVISSITGHTGGVTAVQFTPSGQQLLTASQDNSARLWNSTPGIAPL
ncbi:MAG: hypothetical protein GY943_16915, partial [Chloroflexi bacterium]|nr:hypothetical protein [Chloroflexota bacterium]